MNEEALKHLTTDQLLAQMIYVTNEVIELHRRQADRQTTHEKLKEIREIQKIIVQRRADETSLK